MALNNIILDDKPWSKIAEEARLLIPSFSREWTDHNAHDPGITFLELFAWLEEIQRYRLNRTSTAIRESFFAMAGVEPRGAYPASAMVEFTPPDVSEDQSVEVSAGTRLIITAHLDLDYETVRDSYLVASKISAVQTQIGVQELDRTEAEKDAAGHFDAFGPTPKVGDALVVTFDRPVQAPEITLTFRVFDADLPPIVPGPLPIPSVELRWEYKTARSWHALTVIGDTTAALTLSGFITFRDPGEPASAIRAVVSANDYEIPPRLVSIRLNALEVRQIRRELNRDLGLGTGLPDQKRKLPNAPLREALAPVIQVGRPGSLEEWSPTNDFSASDPESKHYTFDAATGEILFGNGLNGRIPQTEDRIVVKEFRHTSGAEGNLNPDLNWRLTAPQGATTWVGKNPLAATGGTDAESLTDTELRARKEFRQSVRAVTVEDIEMWATQTPGVRVARAKALPGWTPLCPAVASPGNVTVVVLPVHRNYDSRAPVPSSGFLATVTRQLQMRRLVTNRIHVIGPHFVPISIAATIMLKKRAAEADVRRDVKKSLREFLSANNWPFGRDIFPSEIYQRLMGVSGVAFASQVRINGSPDRLVLKPIELPELQDMTLAIQRAPDA